MWSVSTMADRNPTLEELREQVRTNHSSRFPNQAVAQFDSLIAVMRENKALGTAKEAERKALSAEWNARKDDIRFRENYAKAKTAVSTANFRYINAARQANTLLGQDLFKTKGWNKGTDAGATALAEGGEHDVH
jgi:hypothetical protein